MHRVHCNSFNIKLKYTTVCRFVCLFGCRRRSMVVVGLSLCASPFIVYYCYLLMLALLVCACLPSLSFCCCYLLLSTHCLLSFRLLARSPYSQPSLTTKDN